MFFGGFTHSLLTDSFSPSFNNLFLSIPFKKKKREKG